MEEKERCALCHVEREAPMFGIKSDHLRTVYMVNDRKLDPSHFMPRLSIEERHFLMQGVSRVCSNRAKCRERQRRA